MNFILFLVVSLVSTSALAATRYDGTLGTGFEERANCAALLGRICKGKVTAFLDLTDLKGTLTVADTVGEMKLPLVLDALSSVATGTLQVQPTPNRMPARTLMVEVAREIQGVALEIFVVNSSEKHLLFTTAK